MGWLVDRGPQLWCITTRVFIHNKSGDLCVGRYEHRPELGNIGRFEYSFGDYDSWATIKHSSFKEQFEDLGPL